VSGAHLVLGLLELQGGVAVNVLWKHGLTAEVVENYLSTRRGSSDAASAQEGSVIGRSADIAFKRAEATAHKLGHTYVGTEHLLIGILAEETGEAADLFASLHTDRKAIGFEVFREIAPMELWAQPPTQEIN
jgi:ATP-dependent Clp protease ATP-binding subunit ClpA